MTNNWIEIGKIISPQGLQGKVKVSPLNNLGDILEQSGEHSDNGKAEVASYFANSQKGFRLHSIIWNNSG